MPPSTTSAGAASPAQRKLIMQRFAELMRLNLVELALLESLDMGKPSATPWV